MPESAIRECWHCTRCKFTYKSVIHLVTCQCPKGHLMKKNWDRRTDKAMA